MGNACYSQHTARSKKTLCSVCYVCLPFNLCVFNGQMCTQIMVRERETPEVQTEIKLGTRTGLKQKSTQIWREEKKTERLRQRCSEGREKDRRGKSRDKGRDNEGGGGERDNGKQIQGRYDENIFLIGMEERHGQAVRKESKRERG